MGVTFRGGCVSVNLIWWEGMVSYWGLPYNGSNSVWPYKTLWCNNIIWIWIWIWIWLAHMLNGCDKRFTFEIGNSCIPCKHAIDYAIDLTWSQRSNKGQMLSQNMLNFTVLLFLLIFKHFITFNIHKIN